MFWEVPLYTQNLKSSNFLCPSPVSSFVGMWVWQQKVQSNAEDTNTQYLQEAYIQWIQKHITSLKEQIGRNITTELLILGPQVASHHKERYVAEWRAGFLEAAKAGYALNTNRTPFMIEMN